MENNAINIANTQKSKMGKKYIIGIVIALAIIALSGYLIYEKKYKEEFTATDSAQLQSFMLKGDFLGAESLALWYEAKFPDNIEIKLTKGIAEFQIHKFKEAAQAFQAVIALEPQNDTANRYMSIMLTPPSPKATTTAKPATKK